jgi:hypothetical protein
MSPTEPPKSIQRIQIDNISYIGEQDGPYERRLKEQLVEIFKSNFNIQRVYLARVKSDSESGFGVVLALRTTVTEKKQLVDKIGEVFALIFSATDYLDTIFIDDREEMKVKNVCSPFYNFSDQISH